MKNFKKKWFISASSGILGRILLVFFGLSVGFFGRQFISVPIDKDIIKGVGLIVGIVVLIFASGAFIYFLWILEWFAYRRESDNKKRQLENEKLQLENEKSQLENEKLQLKLELQEKQSLPDNDE